MGLVGLVAWVRASGGEGDGKATPVVIPEGAGPAEIAAVLAEGRVVRGASRFARYLAWFCSAEEIAPGAHLLRDDLSAPRLCAALTRSDAREKIKVVIPEGYHRFDIAKRLEDRGVAGAQAFVAATVDPALLRELSVPAATAEGYLFPATYSFAENTPPSDVVRRLRQEMDTRLARLRQQLPDFPGATARELGFSLHDVVTLASMVEKEAVVDDERPLVAGVFVNRFRDPTFVPKPPRLQSDPTSAYGCLVSPTTIPACSGFSGKITPELNRDPKNPYSTYVNAGLPPGPICNPGEKSLMAAASPADTKFLYFVAKGGGRHTFSATLAEHEAAVRSGGKR